MLYKLIDRSEKGPHWTWIAKIQDDKVDILYGSEYTPKGLKWSPFHPENTASDDWRVWSNWAPMWKREPLSYEEFFAALL